MYISQHFQALHSTVNLKAVYLCADTSYDVVEFIDEFHVDVQYICIYVCIYILCLFG